jgi:hypothetical protein
MQCIVLWCGQGLAEWERGCFMVGVRRGPERERIVEGLEVDGLGGWKAMYRLLFSEVREALRL